MRYSQTLIKTLREVPQDAEIRSHQLMLKAGLIQKLASGLYSFLPLGLRALRKFEIIIRERMEAYGADEILLPVLQPPELWQKTGRWDSMRDLIFVVKDRQDRDIVLGPTHEEVITDLVAKSIKSYRDMPLNLYQIQTKFRDEIRPRFGLMRAKEFIMKDGYSFDVNEETARKTYWNMYKAYEEIFSACGLKYKVVEADTGVMGGSLSHEFTVLADSGEDEIFFCEKSGYAANREMARRIPRTVQQNKESELEEISTPGEKTVGEVSAFLNVGKEQLIKTLIYQSEKDFIAVLCRGDYEINEGKIKRFLAVSHLELADENDVIRLTGASSGFSGPIGLKDIKILMDDSVTGMMDAIVGANKNNTHFKHVKEGRDFIASSTGDFAYAEHGDLCPTSNLPMEYKRGIEVGHVFYLGIKYTSALNASYLDESGKSHPCVMGCYGIGVSRTIAAFVEQNSDENGIIWHPRIAPYEVIIVPVNCEDNEMMDAALEIYKNLKDSKFDVLLDDRNERAGVKFKDADLIGFPFRITIGKKYMQTGSVELTNRRTKESILVKKDEIINKLNEISGEWF